MAPTTYPVAYDPAAGDDPDLLTAALLVLRAHAWAAVLDDHADTDLDLPALRAGFTEGLRALAGFETLTKHTASAPSSRRPSASSTPAQASKSARHR